MEDSVFDTGLSGGLDPLPEAPLSESVELKKIDEQTSLVASFEQPIKELRYLLKSLRSNGGISKNEGIVLESIAGDSLPKSFKVNYLTQEPSLTGYKESLEAIEEAIRSKLLDYLETINNLKDPAAIYGYLESISNTCRRLTRDKEKNPEYPIGKPINDTFKSLFNETIAKTINPYTLEFFLDDNKRVTGLQLLLAMVSRKRIQYYTMCGLLTDILINLQNDSDNKIAVVNTMLARAGDVNHLTNYYADVIEADPIDIDYDTLISKGFDVNRGVKLCESFNGWYEADSVNSVLFCDFRRTAKEYLEVIDKIEPVNDTLEKLIDLSARVNQFGADIHIVASSIERTVSRVLRVVQGYHVALIAS